jgi:REP element-mobilizing transposase RayT
VPHVARPVQRAAEPVHVTLRARISSLRSQFVYPTVRLALARAARHAPERFRILHFSVQHDHVHLLVEAADKRALSGGMRGVAIRVARYVNDLLGRRGPLWADRWHGRALRTPREVRNGLVYVLANFKKHVTPALARCESRRSLRFDPYSSARCFDGWRESVRNPNATSPGPPGERRVDGECPVNSPQTWLARVGWRRHGLLAFGEAPAF